MAGDGVPVRTLIVNLVGAFVIGVVQQLGLEALVISQPARRFLTTGVMGAERATWPVEARAARWRD